MDDASLKRKWDMQATLEYYQQREEEWKEVWKEGFIEGFREGYEIGRKEARYKLISGLLQRNFDESEIATMAGVTQNYINQVRKDLEINQDQQE